MVKKIAVVVFKTTLTCLFYCAVFLGIVKMCLSGYEFGYKIFSNPVYDSNAVAEKTFAVNHGESETSIVKRLQTDGIVEDYRAAYIRLQFSEYKNKIKPGTYKLKASMPMDEVLCALTGADESASDAEELEDTVQENADEEMQDIEQENIEEETQEATEQEE